MEKKHPLQKLIERGENLTTRAYGPYNVLRVVNSDRLAISNLLATFLMESVSLSENEREEVLEALTGHVLVSPDGSAIDFLSVKFHGE